MSTYTPFPGSGGGGGGGSEDLAPIKARIGRTETKNAGQDDRLDDHGRRILAIEETPPLDLAPIDKRLDDLEAGGVVGPAGPQGPQGVPGVDGARGPAGERGPAGADGVAGRDGTSGAQGLQGPAGPEGPIGPAGERGPQGIAGVAGADGAPGVQGPQGERGERGPAGADAPPTDLEPVTSRIGLLEQADRDFDKALDLETDTRAEADRLLGVRVKAIEDGDGVPGPAGPVGPQGPAGPQGASGVDGAPGAAGPQGPAGADGAPGAAGPQGPVGPQGEAGAAGEQGPVGDKGPTGDKGVQGDPGVQGPLGGKGATGDRGLQGPVGDKGVQGDKGVTGDKGPIGDKGPSGDAGSGSGGGRLVRKHMIRIRTSQQISPKSIAAANGWADVTHGRSVAIGAGASGARASSQTYAQGGLAGIKREGPLFKLVEGQVVDIEIGAGGSRPSGGTNRTHLSVAGGPTRATLRASSDGAVLHTIVGEGGASTNANVGPTTGVEATRWMPAGPRPIPIPGRGSNAATNASFTKNVNPLADGQDAYDGPAPGGGASDSGSSATIAATAGRGGSVIYPPDRLHGRSQDDGGRAGYYDGSTWVFPTSAVNPDPSVPGTYGAGGGGLGSASTLDNASANAGDGAEPGGGGGAAVYSTTVSGRLAGAGGGGGYDLELWGPE